AYNPAAGTVLHAGTQTLSATFTPTDTTDYVSGGTITKSLGVSKAQLTLTVDNKSVNYGYALPALTYSLSGFVNGDTAASLTSPVTCVTQATTTSQGMVSSVPGSYYIHCSATPDGDYLLGYLYGKLTVGQAPLTVTAQNASVVYAGKTPSLSYKGSGFVLGQAFSNFSTKPSCTTQQQSNGSGYDTSPAGSYSIDCSGGVDSNYAISYVSGTMTVNLGT